jgi:hypothetical protein
MTFEMDALAPLEDQGRASDYARTGYDLGHMAPAEDFAWSKTRKRETFSMANIEPQLLGLNRQGWPGGATRLLQDRPRSYTGWALAFMVSQANLTKAKAADMTVAVETVTTATGIVLPLPGNVDLTKATVTDHGVLPDYRAGRCKAD